MAILGGKMKPWMWYALAAVVGFYLYNNYENTPGAVTAANTAQLTTLQTQIGQNPTGGVPLTTMQEASTLTPAPASANLILTNPNFEPVA
jgi:hypothetical protein